MREYFICINEHVKEVEIIYPLQPLLILRGCEQQNRVAWTERDGIISLVRFLSFEYDLLSLLLDTIFSAKESYQTLLNLRPAAAV